MESCKRKAQVICKGKPAQTIADSSMEPLKVRRFWNKALQELKTMMVNLEYQAKLLAIIEGKGKKIMTQTTFKIVYPKKQTQRKYRTQHFGLKSGISMQGDYTKNFGVIIIKTSSITENTNCNVNINNTIIAINTHFNNNF